MPAERCRCGGGKDPRYVYCWTCYAKLPYELRKELRTRAPAAALLAKCDEWLESEARKQAAKLDRLGA